MSKNTGILLIVWNLLLSALVAWGLLRSPAPDTNTAEAPAGGEAPTEAPVVERDSIRVKDARIAYFFMDSVQQRFDLVKEQGERFRKEGRKLETDLQNEMGRAQRRYQELMNKDHTFSTQAELQADEQELQSLVGRIQELQARSEERLVRMEAEMLAGISSEIMDFLTDYNKVAGYDYIFSVQNGGQIWVGNTELDVTEEVVNGLNKRHRTRKDSGE